MSETEADKAADAELKPRETTVFRGRIGEVVHIEQPDGRVFEQFRRPPGTRLIVISPDNKILVSKEYRHETGTVDLRLPGGKVCDSLEDYDALRRSGADIVEQAKLGVTKEAGEEAGLDIHDPRLIAVANAGATVDWDLYYWEVHQYSERPEGQDLEQGEAIETLWMEPAELRQAIEDGQMREWRSAGVLLAKVLPRL